MRWAEAGVALALACAAVPAAPAPAAERSPSAERVPILTYHRVGGSPRFARQVAALDRAGYEAVTLGELWFGWHLGARLPRRPVVLSFDDGYLSQYRTAARTLRARRWPGVLNLQAGRLGASGGLTRRHVRRMIGDGWEVGAHSITHPDLTAVGPERLQREVAGSRAALERKLGVAVMFFCYPYGRVDAEVEAAVRAAGFFGATTIRRGLASPQTDRFGLPRISVAARTSPRVLLRRVRAAE